ncbi:ABC transporter substrate-binding protein [Coraliomargarita sp. SDUM461004]|uniref:histidine kinase n=1 Tax=Thalassobacterium sedimentorum TaxID=3041258 RepID=A0ABU1AMQ8_9BACT|nr:ABC transporter substrate-binding protein [Coraliomargarita sp. SDUM461004]MDQ8195498.1 ABC transporter substrate-binding protein [Coraliomargarita sp. SDUM461004]
METITLQLKWSHQFQFAGYYAAIEKGYYSEAGLDVHVVEAQANKGAVQAVVDGDANYGIATSELVQFRSQGAPVVALAAIFQHSPHALISMREADVSTIQDLVDQKIMIQNSSADLISLLKQAKVPFESVNYAQHATAWQQLTEGKIKALAGYVTNEPYALSQAGYQPLIFSPQSVGIDFYGDCLFTTESRIRKHPQQVEAFRKASLRGWNYALDHPEEIIDFIVSKYTQRKSKAELTFEAEKTHALIRPDLVELGHMNPRRWEHIADILQEEGLLAQTFDIHEMLYQNQYSFPLAPFLQMLSLCLLALLVLAAFTYHQIKLRRQLQAEITQRKLGDQTLRQREAEYRNLFQNAPMAFIVWDNELRICEWNHAAEKLFGWSAPEVIGKAATHFLVPESAQSKVTEGRTRLHQESSLTQINDNLTKDGRIITCRWHNVSRRSPDGRTIEFHSIAFDVSKEEQERARLKEECSQARNASEAKDQLLARTSHEIRNPLNAIMGFTQLLYSDLQDPETKKMAKVILDGAEGLLEILNDLLDSAKIDAGKMAVNWQSVDLINICEKAIKLFSQIIAKQGLKCELIIQARQTVIVSAPRCLQQILSNLINNARKFTLAGGITVTLKEDNESELSLQVSDTGIGMSPTTLEQVFEPFVQADSEINQNFGGTGLGLTLTKKLSSLIGGSLSAESELGRGSTFTLQLPRAPHIPKLQTAHIPDVNQTPHQSARIAN